MSSYSSNSSIAVRMVGFAARSEDVFDQALFTMSTPNTHGAMQPGKRNCGNSELNAN